MKQADAIETLAALAAWSRTLAEWRASSDPDTKAATIERFADEHADRCSRALRAALHPRCRFTEEDGELHTAPWRATELLYRTAQAAKALGTTDAEIVRLAVDYAARHALEDLEALGWPHNRGVLIERAHATLRAARCQ